MPFSIYAAVDKDTVAIWLLDEGAGDTVEDVSGNGHDGTFVGDPEWVDAKYGKGLDFKGSSENYVEVPHSDDLNLDEWTIEGWFLVHGTVGDWDCPFTKETTGPTNRDYALYIQAGGGIIHGSISVGNAFGHVTYYIVLSDRLLLWER